MRIRPTRIHLFYVCFIFISYALLLSCSKDKDSFINAFLEQPVVFVEEQKVESIENPEDTVEENRTTTFPTIHDAYLQSGKGYNQNVMRLKEGFRTSYLMFDLSPIKAIEGKIQGAKLQFTIDSDNGSGNITVYNSKSNNWSETDLSTDSEPKIDLELGSIAKEYNIGTTEIIELFSESLLPQRSTLILVHTNGDDLAFASKEHVDKIGPKLVVSYTVPKDADEIEIVVEEESTEEDNTNNTSNEGPMAVGDASPTSGTVPLIVTFKSDNSSDDTGIVSYLWDFKDGSSDTNPNPTHTFNEVGIYEVILTVKDDQELSSSDVVTITVTEKANNAPVAKVSATPIVGQAPLQVSFTGSDSTDDNAISSYIWNYKDGNTENKADTSHTFITPGNYEVELEVKDENGLSDIETITITVTENEAPVAIVSANTTSGNAPVDVQFTGSNSTDDNAITSYYWNFMDGSSSTESNPSHVFNTPGNYLVELTVQDAEGLNHSASININVSPQDTGNAPPGSYYVSVNGSSNNDGLSESNAWSIEHAFTNAKAGDFVYIKAGNYGNVRLEPGNSGTPSNPVRFIGYRNQPGDIVASGGSTFNYGDSLDANKMPLIKGQRINNEGQGAGVYNFHSNIEISNLQITHYKQGVFSSGDYNVLDNIIVTEVGDFNPAHTYPNNTSNSTLNYEGFGFNISGNFSEIKNSFVLNAGAEGFRFSNCQFQKHSYNKVYSDSNVNPCDYYYLLSEGAENNDLTNIYVERLGDLEHFGHGLILKFSAKSNKIKNSTVKNAWLELSYSEVSNNEFTNCTVVGGVDDDGALMIANGAHDNTFINCNVTRCNGVGFSDWDEDFSRGDVNNAGHHNTFKQCTFDNNRAGIIFNVFSQENTDSPAHDNTFDNCTFSNMDYLFLVDRVNNNNLLKNCTINNINSLKSSFLPSIHSNIPLNAVYQNNTLLNCGFTLD